MLFLFIIACIIIIIDQLSKYYIVTHYNIGDSVSVIDNVFYITSHRNAGAAWGILQGHMWFFYIITFIVILGIIYVIIKHHATSSTLLNIALSLLLGGAIGNFIDRLVNQQVVDFLHFYIFNYNFPIFNVADMALCIGVGLLLIDAFVDNKKANQ